MTRKEAIDKVYGMIGTAEQHEALDFLVPEIRELRESYDRQQKDERIRKEISNLYSDIDDCITELLKARTDKDSEAEGKALFKMEGIMVGTLQDLSCIEDYLEKQKEQEHICDLAQYEEGFKTGLEIGLRKQKEQKQEWSEKDSLHLKNAILSAEKEWGTESCTAKWLKSLPKRFSPQLKQKWSDEFEENIRELLYNKLKWDSENGRISTAVFIDDKTLKDIVTGIWFYVGKEAMKYPDTELFKYEWSEEERKILDSIIDDYEKAERSFCGYAGKIGFLRAIRDGEYGLSKQEWSEEDEKIVKSIINYLSYDGTQAILTVEIDKWIAWLKSLKSHWKPNEEQMEAFKKYIEEFQARAEVAVGGWNNFDVMIQLYEQLKKLQSKSGKDDNS